VTARDLAYGAALFAGCACAFGVPRVSRQAAVVLALGMTVAWLVFHWTFAAAPPQVWLRDHGAPVQAYHLWLLTDATVGLLGICSGVVGLSGARNEGWWGWAIWGLSSAMLAAHTSKWELGVLDQGQYYQLLDWLFLASVATLILAGGGGVASFLGSSVSRLWRHRRVVRGLGRVLASAIRP